MGRRRMCRRLSELPLVKGFKPLKPQPFQKDPVILSLDQFEALRLCDYQGLSQEEAAIQMEISRPTFTRLYTEARKNLVQAVVEGRVFVMQGGNVKLNGQFLQCKECHTSFKVEKEVSSNHCPHCGSHQVFSKNDFFMKGCGFRQKRRTKQDS